MMLDTSGSMFYDFAMVKIDSKAFVRCARPNDQFGVNHFNNNAAWVYPTGPNPGIITVDSQLAETQKATDAIEQLSCSSNLTNIGAAIRLGNQMIATANTDLKAFVLFSDGCHNTGESPLNVLAGEPPIYIAGLGYLDVSYFRKLVAKNPNSKFYNQPNAYDVMIMFNEILADSSDSLLMLNKLDNVETGAQFLLEKFYVSSFSNSAQVSMVWTDPAYAYTPNPPRSVGDIQVTLIDPNNKSTDLRPKIAEGGYCIYDLDNVAAGEWKALVQYVADKPLAMTLGAIDHHATTRTVIRADTFATRGDAVKFSVAAHDSENEVEILSVKSTVSKPTVSVKTALERHSAELSKLEVEDSSDGDIAKLNILRNKKLHKGEPDILPSVKSFAYLKGSDDGHFEGAIKATDVAGAYTANFEIEGIYPKTGEKFKSFASHTVAVNEGAAQ